MDWNITVGKHGEKSVGHTLRGCVDWNNPGEEEAEWVPEVTPYVGVWIETHDFSRTDLNSQSHTLRGCVDWNFRYSIFAN